MIDLNNQLLGDEVSSVDLNEALTICEQSSRDGVEEIVITLRMTRSAEDDPSRVQGFEHSLMELRRQLAGRPQINLKLSCGYEWTLSDDLPDRLRDFNGHPTINEGNYLLISLPSLSVPTDYERLIDRICADGYRPIISHPECSRFVRRSHAVINNLTKMGCLIQADALSILGGYTKEIELFTRELLEQGQIHFLASRAGRQNRREASLSSALLCASRIIGRGAAQSLVKENPTAVLANATATEMRGWSNSPAPAFKTALNSRT